MQCTRLEMGDGKESKLHVVRFCVCVPTDDTREKKETLTSFVQLLILTMHYPIVVIQLK